MSSCITITSVSSRCASKVAVTRSAPTSAARTRKVYTNLRGRSTVSNSSLIHKIEPSFYFFSSSRWESALSSGAIAHLKVEEINRYAAANFLIHHYSSLESIASPAWINLEAYFAARPTLGQQDLLAGLEKLMLFQDYVKTMIHVGEQLQEVTNYALAGPS